MRPYSKLVSKYYDLVLDNQIKSAPLEVKFFKSFWKNKVNSVLDLGCGTGRLCIAFADQGYDVVGTDITPAMLDIAKSKGSNAHFKIADMRTFVFRTKFDAVVCGNSTMLHLMTIKDVKKTLSSTYKNLKNHGFFVFDVWDVEKWKPINKWKYTVTKPGIVLKNTEISKIDRKNHIFYWNQDAKIDDHGKKFKISFGGKLRYRPREEWLSLLKEAGFKDVKILTRKKFGDKLYFVARK